LRKPSATAGITEGGAMPNRSQQQKPAPFSDDEITKLRELLERRERIKWLWSSVKAWAVLITSVIGAWAVGIDTLKSILAALLAKG
jgi:hypothetical protein